MIWSLNRNLGFVKKQWNWVTSTLLWVQIKNSTQSYDTYSESPWQLLSKNALKDGNLLNHDFDIFGLEYAKTDIVYKAESVKPNVQFLATNGGVKLE